MVVTTKLLLGSLVCVGAAGLRAAPHGSRTPREYNISRPTLDADEAAGLIPTFVDAFLSADGSKAYIVLLTKVLKAKTEAYKELAGADWRCRWSSQTQVVETQPEAPSSDAHRHTLVVECPTPSGTAWMTKLKVSLSARSQSADGEIPVYTRDDISIRSETLLEKSETALCTMAIQKASASPYLYKWLYYNLNLGFDQILLYIEDKNTDWWRNALQEFPGVGRVRLVQFYFGEFSDKRRWIMQQAQEVHCLYHAKGKVDWLGHCDGDEYFQPLSSYHGGIKSFLNTMPQNLGAVSVQNQFWFWDHSIPKTKQDDLGGLEPPCDMTCKAPGFTTGSRQKLLMRPDSVLYFSVHQITHMVRGYKSKAASPLTEVRLNHFKSISPPNQRLWASKPCEVEDSFQQFCKELSRPARFAQMQMFLNTMS